MTKKNCNDNCACSHVDGKQCQCTENETLDYGFYSNVLKKPFEKLDDLKKAEYVYFEEQKLKEDKAAQKKADAQKVEEAFKALNAARKVYKEELIQLTKEYSEELESLKKAYDLGKEDITKHLADAEDAYAATLKEFTDKHENFHLTLRDGDFETTVSGSSKTGTEANKPTTTRAFDLFDLIFGL